jgi:hypothetical protein
MRWWLALALIGCGDNRLVADASVDAPRPDAAPDAAGAPDLTLIAAEMTGTILVTQDTFAPDACEVAEACVDAAGQRRLVRFDTVTANIGTADLVIGVPPPVGQSDATFEWSPCHHHHHVRDYASYELLDATQAVVVTGRKQAFCLEDTEQVRAGALSHSYSCANQGMSAGWADVYSRGLPCQWIDVTSVPTGTYTLRVVVDPTHRFADSDLTDNEFTATVTL